jgi:hypothetical protein
MSAFAQRVTAGMGANHILDGSGPSSDELQALVAELERLRAIEQRAETVRDGGAGWVYEEGDVAPFARFILDGEA